MKIDLHVHSSELSPCGKLTLEETISLYQKTDYDAIVITNHFSNSLREFYSSKGIEDYISYYFEYRERAVETGRKKGFLVLPGCEFQFKENCNDYLVFGLTQEHFKIKPDLFDMTPETFSEFANENGILFYQAHPFRNRMSVINPEYLFGIEAFNGHPRHDSRNDIAEQWAEKYELRKIAGSDCHRTEDVGTAGIITDHPVKTIEELIHVLKNGLYTLYKKP